MGTLPKIPANASKLTEEASIEVICLHWNPDFDMISFFNKNGYNVISSDDERASNPATFVYNKRTSTLHTPFMKPEEVLPFMKELQQKFEEYKIGYSPFRTKYKDQFVEPLSKQKPEVLPDEVVLEQLKQHNLEKISKSSFEDLYKENITDEGPLKLYRGTAMGDCAHTTCSTNIREMITYAAPYICRACGYAGDTIVASRFNFIEEYQASPEQIYAPDHGIESNLRYDSIDWKKSEYKSYYHFETFVEKETNPHLATYIHDSHTQEIHKIYENGKYVSKFWEEYAKSRRPQKKYDGYISSRVQNIIDGKRKYEFDKRKNLMAEHPIMAKICLASMCSFYIDTKDEKLKTEMLKSLYEIRKSGEKNKDKRNMAGVFKHVLDENPRLKKDEKLVALSKIDTIFSKPTNIVKTQITR